MKKVIKFSKAFLPASILSALLILSGAVSVFTRGINFGIDFQPGLIEEIRIAPPALELTYSGSAKVTVDMAENGMDVIISGSGADNRTETFSYDKNPTVGALASNLNKIDGLSARIVIAENTASSGLFVNSALSNVITENVFRLYASGTETTTIEDVRSAVDSFKGVAVKALGTESARSFQIRMRDNGGGDSGKTLQDGIKKALENRFGADKVVVIKTDFIASQFSQSLIWQSIVLVLATLLLIWLYATIRFHWDFALGSVIALIHDALIMITFISWTQIEFSTTTLAAVLTIIGYSINATVVILDRVRLNMKLLDVKKFDEILNASLSDTLGRSLITTITTLFAVFALFIFTTGGIKDFSLALMVGLVSGCYSSICISSAFISFVRRNWSPEAGMHHSFRKAVSARPAVAADDGVRV